MVVFVVVAGFFAVFVVVAVVVVGGFGFAAVLVVVVLRGAALVVAAGLLAVVPEGATVRCLGSPQSAGICLYSLNLLVFCFPAFGLCSRFFRGS